MRRRPSFGMLQERAYRNMRNARFSNKKETFLLGVGQGLVVLAIGVAILVINVQSAASPTVSMVTSLSQVPTWVWVVGGGLGLFGLYWIIRNIWLFVSLAKINKSTK